MWMDEGGFASVLPCVQNVLPRMSPGTPTHFTGVSAPGFLFWKNLPFPHWVKYQCPPPLPDFLSPPDRANNGLLN